MAFSMVTHEYCLKLIVCNILVIINIIIIYQILKLVMYILKSQIKFKNISSSSYSYIYDALAVPLIF